VNRPRPAAWVRLICLPAAGVAISYRDCPAHLSDEVEAVPVQLPGRENRFHEQPIESMERLVSWLQPWAGGRICS
jgi:surfactin synthase thioesterase subunit